MAKEKDFYLVLGVNPSATGEQIRLAYDALAKKHHPDNFSSYIEKARATLAMQEINAAYEVLANLSERCRYDQDREQSFSGIQTNDSNQGKTSDSKGSYVRPRSTIFSSILEEFYEHPYRTWFISIPPITIVIFLLLELDYSLGQHFLTAKTSAPTQHVFLALLLCILFFNPFMLMLFGGPIAFFALLIFGLPIFAVSEGMKRGLGKTFYKTSNSAWRLMVDAGVRVGSLVVLTLLAILYPGVTLVLVLMFPYNLFILFGLSVWIGETIAVVIFVRRSRTVRATTEMLLRL